VRVWMRWEEGGCIFLGGWGSEDEVLDLRGRCVGLSKVLWSLGYCVYEYGWMGTHVWRCAVLRSSRAAQLDLKRSRMRFAREHQMHGESSGLESPALKFSKRVFKRSQATHSCPAPLLLNLTTFTKLANVLSIISFMLIR
jgi:hypothetical protein